MAVQDSQLIPGKYDFVCTEPRCGWASSGWDTPEQADARGDQHLNEHATGEQMQELTAFETDNGFERNEVNAAVADAVEERLTDEGVELSQKG